MSNTQVATLLKNSEITEQSYREEEIFTAFQ